MSSVLDQMVVKLLNCYYLVYRVLVLLLFILSSPWIGFLFHAIPSFLLIAYIHIYLGAYFCSEWLTMSDLDRFTNEQ